MHLHTTICSTRANQGLVTVGGARYKDFALDKKIASFFGRLLLNLSQLHVSHVQWGCGARSESWTNLIRYRYTLIPRVQTYWNLMQVLRTTENVYFIDFQG